MTQVMTRLNDRAWLELNLSNLRHNVAVLQAAFPDECKLMAVVKANAYGHGAGKIALYLNDLGIDAFAVATIDEAIDLRNQGLKADILILGYTDASRAEELFRYSLTQAVIDYQHAEELAAFNLPIKVQVKVDTGMNRLGQSYQDYDQIANIFSFEHLEVTGIFTHLSVADSLMEADVEFTRKQITRFYSLIEQLKERKIPIPATHIQSSYGILNYPELRCQYARIGIALYGVLSSSNTPTRLQLDLKPVLALKTKVALVKNAKPGEYVGYGRAYQVKKDTTIAIIPIGYADGLPRSLSEQQCDVLINGSRAPIIGRVCMDQHMVDVTDIPHVKRGDIVTLIGKDGTEEIRAEEVAGHADTITNELLSRLSERIERFLTNH